MDIVSKQPRGFLLKSVFCGLQLPLVKGKLKHIVLKDHYVFSHCACN